MSRATDNTFNNTEEITHLRGLFLLTQSWRWLDTDGERETGDVNMIQTVKTLSLKMKEFCVFVILVSSFGANAHCYGIRALHFPEITS